MIKLQPGIISGIRAASSADELGVYLQNAIELEHSTIPPYLTAMFSLRSGANEQIAGHIREIVIEEMLHTTIAANILIAIGGHPSLKPPRFFPENPPPPPREARGLTGGIGAFSINLAQGPLSAIR